MTDDRDDLLANLHAALDIQPSVEFEARVRQRVESEIWRPFPPRWLASAAVVAVACLAIALVVGRLELPPAASSAFVWPPSGDAPKFVAVQPRREAIPDELREPPTARVERVTASAPRVSVMSRQIIVPRDQEAGLARLVAEIRAGRIAFGEAPWPVPDTVGVVALSAPARLDVPPLGVEPLSVDGVSDFRR